MDRWARYVRQGWWALLAVAWLGMLAQAGRAETAVVVVGPVDPPVNRETRTYIAEANSVARVLTQAGYDVVKLYHPQATWERVKEAAQGASVFVYFGHGNGYGWQGQTEPEAINGLCLSYPDNPDAILSGSRVPGGSEAELASLELNAATVVMVHSCYTAGSTMEDREAADFDTAKARVTSYAQAFFHAGAKEYAAFTQSGQATRFLERQARGVSAAEAVRQGEHAQVVHAESDLVLVEQPYPSNPYPWVSACVTQADSGLATAPREAEESGPRSQQEQAGPAPGSRGSGCCRGAATAGRGAIPR